MVEVFSTNVQTKMQAEGILKVLESSFPESKINFDLDDLESTSPCCHSILRVEGAAIYSEIVISIVNKAGYMCDILEDKICK
jgi:hypothetical protein